MTKKPNLDTFFNYRDSRSEVVRQERVKQYLPSPTPLIYFLVALGALDTSLQPTQPVSRSIGHNQPLEVSKILQRPGCK